ncbi:MAG: ATP-binding protein [Oscillospiraceae bacterium]|jgi:hypothetical protein|nr:ATP-binding protein [Oscillospiraceae bacterium]
MEFSINDLQRDFSLADQFIEKSFLDDLTKFRVVPLEDTKKRFNSIRLLSLTKIVYDKDEGTNDKLVSVFSAVQSLKSNVVFIVDGNEKQVEIYLGIQSYREAGTADKVFSKGFLGNFPGSVTDRQDGELIEQLMSRITDYINTNLNISCLNIVPSNRGEKQDKFVQGLEKFIDTMRGEVFTAIIIASSVTNMDCESRTKGYEQLYSTLYPFTNVSLSHGTNSGNTITEGFTDTISTSISKGIAKTTGQQNTDMEGESTGFNAGMFGVGVSLAKMKGRATGAMSSTGSTDTTSSSNSESKSTSESETTGVTDSFTMTHKDKLLENTLERIEQHIERLKDCMTYGMWECCAYFIADTAQVSVVAANTFRSLMLGDSTKCEKTYFNFFGLREKDATKNIAEYLRYCQHPTFEIDTPHGKQLVSSTNYISGKELPILINLPRKSVSGVTITSIAEFGRNISDAAKASKKIDIGNVYHMDSEETTQVSLNLDSLSSHCFVTGSTGSGKSNTIYCLIEKLLDKEYDIPFLIIEPAKGEYKYAFCNVPDINIFYTNSSIGQFLRINPFRFDPKIHVLEHLDRLIEIFNTCWEMYAAMPAILKDAIEKCYEKKGWDLLHSIYVNDGKPEYPTFKDLLVELPNVINTSGYSSDTKGDYIGALVTRVNSLTNGIIGQIFCDCYDISDDVLFDQKTIVDISRIGSSETKSLIMGILVLKLTEYRMANAVETNAALKHITIIEEAHNLLKNTKASSSPASSIISKSVEMICNNIAEMRTYGEGFIIVDQSPTSVDIAAIKNTNTKIIMRLPELNDCEIAGRSASLNETQIQELSKLKTGVAVVMQNNWSEAVLAKINRYSDQYSGQPVYVEQKKILHFKSAVIGEILNQYTIQKTKSITAVLELIEYFDIDINKKKDAVRAVEAICETLGQNWNSRKFGSALMKYVGCESVFNMAEYNVKDLKKDELSDDSINTWFRYIEKELQKFVEINEDQRRRLVQYLTYSKCYEPSPVNYNEIYKCRYVM